MPSKGKLTPSIVHQPGLRRNFLFADHTDRTAAANLPKRLSGRIQLSAWWKPPHPPHVARCVIRRSVRGRIERIIMSLAAGARLGPYEILASIGAGGMGEVFRARDP